MKNERQELLERLMLQEQENIRKIIKPYHPKNSDIFFHDVVIEERDLVEEKALGLYKFDEKELINHVYIRSEIIDSYMNNKGKRDWWSRYERRQLINTIGHELTHAYVRQMFRHTDIDGVNNDASPVFLGTLMLFGYRTNHNCHKNFVGEDIYNKVLEIKKTLKKTKWFDCFYMYMADYLHGLKAIKEEFNNKQMENVKVLLEGKSNVITMQQINFTFSSRGSGLKKYIQGKDKITSLKDGVMYKNINDYVYFAIGSAMQNLDEIKKLVNKKMNNELFAEIVNGKNIRFAEIGDKNFKKLSENDIKIAI